MIKLKDLLNEVLTEVEKTEFAARSTNDGKLVYYKNKENLEQAIKDKRAEPIKDRPDTKKGQAKKKDVNIFDKQKEKPKSKPTASDPLKSIPAQKGDLKSYNDYQAQLKANKYHEPTWFLVNKKSSIIHSAHDDYNTPLTKKYLKWDNPTEFALVSRGGMESGKGFLPNPKIDYRDKNNWRKAE